MASQDASMPETEIAIRLDMTSAGVVATASATAAVLCATAL
eukprot:SAG11_NODE_219_length_12168_cov_5.600083_1_plen_41_part_00